MFILHDRKLNRLRGYDYSRPGFYAVTICVKIGGCCLGKIKNGIMFLNEWGKIVRDCWHDLPNHYNNCRLDEFAVVPNHIHGIIEIRYHPEFARVGRTRVGTGLVVRTGAGIRTGVGTGLKPVPTVPVPGAVNNNTVKPVPTVPVPGAVIDPRAVPAPGATKRYTLSEIIRGFKTFSSRGINELNNPFEFRWQRSFWDTIIKNEKHLNNARRYIRNNPANWDRDRNNH